MTDNEAEVNGSDTSVASQSGTGREVPPDVEAARERIEQTRAEMSQTVHAIEDELAVERIRGRVLDALREGALSKARQLAESATTVATDKVETVSSAAKRHPRAAAAVGVGAAASAALLEATRRTRRGRTSRSKDAVVEVGETLLIVAAAVPVSAASAVLWRLMRRGPGSAGSDKQ
ncbi:MAG: DUF3618 domain-containing protein [Chloroflexota bacterium]